MDTQNPRRLKPLALYALMALLAAPACTFFLATGNMVKVYKAAATLGEDARGEAISAGLPAATQIHLFGPLAYVLGVLALFVVNQRGYRKDTSLLWKTALAFMLFVLTSKLIAVGIVLLIALLHQRKRFTAAE